jgi:hypothetical protein
LGEVGDIKCLNWISTENGGESVRINEKFRTRTRKAKKILSVSDIFTTALPNELRGTPTKGG